MTYLKSLSFVAASKSRLRDPIAMRRERLRAQLEEQKRLHGDPTYVRAMPRWTKVDGGKKLITKQTRVAPWWWHDASGQMLLMIKVGGRAKEIEKGKAAILIPSPDKLPEVIDTVLKAVAAGELDAILSSAEKKPASPKDRRTTTA